MHDHEVTNANRIPDRMAGLAVPALVLAGAASPAWSRDGVRVLGATIPGAEHRSLPGQDHAVEPAALAPLLIDYLR